MRKIKYTISALALATTLSSSNIYADTVAIGPKIGTQGVGLDARMPIMENVFARVGANYFGYSRNFDDGELKLKGKIKLLTVPFMVDWHPAPQSGFKISLGAAYNGNKVTANASPSKPGIYIISGRIYTVNEVGSVSAKLKLGNSVAGIATIGYDSSFVDNKALSFNFDAGVMYSGKAKLTISATGQAANQGQFLADLRKDADKNLDKIQKYLKFYPILSLGIRYSF